MPKRVTKREMEENNAKAAPPNERAKQALEAQRQEAAQRSGQGIARLPG